MGSVEEGPLEKNPFEESSLLKVVGEHPAIVKLVGAIAPFAPALMRMGERKLREAINFLLQERLDEFYGRVCEEATIEEIKNFQRMSAEKALQGLKEARADEKLVKDVLVRLAILLASLLVS